MVTVNGVGQQLGINTGHSSFNVELTHKASLNDKLSNDVNFNFDALLDSRRNENFSRAPSSCVEGRAEGRATAVAWSNAL